MGGVMRVVGWESKMAGAVNAALDTPFSWGKHDCVMFAADIVHAITGYDFAEPIRGGYDSEESAKRLIGDNYGHGIRAYMGWMMGAEIPANEAGRGDVVAVNMLGELCLGICAGDKCVCVGVKGFFHISMRHAITAWKVA